MIDSSENIELNALLAESRHPDTSFERLLVLAEHPHVDVRRAILDNPGLFPLQENGMFNAMLLEKLSVEFFEEIAELPQFLLHVLVEPIDEMLGVLVEVAARTKDKSRIEHLLKTRGSSNSVVRTAIADNPHTPYEILCVLGNEKTEPVAGVREYVVDNPNVSDDILQTLSNPATESDAWVRRAVAENHRTPKNILLTMCNEHTEPSRKVRKSAMEELDKRGIPPEVVTRILEARDPQTPFDRLVELVKHREVEVRRALLDNPNVCPTNNQGKLNTDLLQRLAESFPEEVANHPVFVLHALIEPTQEMEVVVGVVVARTADVGLMERMWTLWGPSSWWVRRGVAENPKAPVDILRTLGNEQTESDVDVRRVVAKNPKAPEDILRTLGNPATDSNPYVREAAKETLAKRGLA